MPDRAIGRRPFLVRTAAAGAVLAGQGARAAALEPPCGPVRGVTSGGVTAFLGMPYAAPPVGPLRYASPRPRPALDGAARLHPRRRGGDPDLRRRCGVAVRAAAAAGRGLPGPERVDAGYGRAAPGDGVAARGRLAGRAGRCRGDASARRWRGMATWSWSRSTTGWARSAGWRIPRWRTGRPGRSPTGACRTRWRRCGGCRRTSRRSAATRATSPCSGSRRAGPSTASIAQDGRNAGLLHKAIIESGSLHGAPGFPEVDTAAAYAEALAQAAGHGCARPAPAGCRWPCTRRSCNWRATRPWRAAWAARRCCRCWTARCCGPGRAMARCPRSRC